jgi:enoyl-CoA hydratase/carnithine racemase
MRVDDADGVRTITFDRPERKNALTTDDASALADRLDEVTASAFDAVVLTGAGDAFSAGGDVATMAEGEASASEAYDVVRETFGAAAAAILSTPAPVVARVNGDAVGAATALVAACDFAYAAADARFGASFVNVGLIPDTGGTVTLPQLVGLRTAKELIFTGELFSAERAAAMDLVNEAVPADDLDATVDEAVGTLAARPTETIALAKEAIHANLGAPWREGLDREATLQALARGTEAHEEGVAAFLEGRPPEFD